MTDGHKGDWFTSSDSASPAEHEQHPLRSPADGTIPGYSLTAGRLRPEFVLFGSRMNDLPFRFSFVKLRSARAPSDALINRDEVTPGSCISPTRILRFIHPHTSAQCHALRPKNKKASIRNAN